MATPIRCNDWVLYMGILQQFYVQHAQIMVRKGWCNLSFTRNPIANKLSLQFLHHSLQQGEVFQKQEEPPRVMALQPSFLAFHATHLSSLSLQQQPEFDNIKGILINKSLSTTPVFRVQACIKNSQLTTRYM